MSFTYNESGEPIARICSVCQTEKSVNEFGKNKSMKHGITGECKECRKQSYNDKRQERMAYQKGYYAANKEKARQYGKDYRENNLETLRKYSRAYSRANYGKMYETQKNHRLNNPEKHQGYYRKYTLWKKILPNTLTREEWKEVLDHFDQRCALTEAYASDMEHFISMSTGHGGTYVGNVYPVGHLINKSKRLTNPFEWVNRDDHIEKFDMSRWDSLIAYLASVNGLSIEEFTSFVNWCYENPRTQDQVQKDGQTTSIELWKSGRYY